MRITLEFFVGLFLKLFMRWSYWISKEKRVLVESGPNLEFEDIHKYAITLSKKWSYISDPLFGVYNTIASPEIVWRSLEGDCDDFASHLIQLSRNYKPILLTYFTWNEKDAHTVVLIWNQNDYYTFNWGQLNQSSNFETCIEQLERYAGSKIISYHTAKYDYIKRRFVPSRVN